MTSYKKEAINAERELSVYKRDDMIQKGRFKNSVQAQRAIAYIISKVKPQDSSFAECDFDIKELYQIIGFEEESYTRFKAMMKALADSSWWLGDGQGNERLLRWFSSVIVNKNSGKVRVKLHEDMVPFLLMLSGKDGHYYTGYNLKFILPMKSKYSPRLYELIKSYIKNNRSWFFDIDELKKRLDCEGYSNYANFRARVLEPAVADINKFTDILVEYQEVREGRKVVRIVFFMDKKTTTEMIETEGTIQLELDGQLDLNLFIEETRNGKRADFIRSRKAARDKEGR